MTNPDVIEKDGETYLSGRAVLMIIISEAVNMTELKPHLKCKKIVKEISKLMAIRRYGGGVSEIFEEIMKLKDPKEQKDFVFKIYDRFIFPDDIKFLLSKNS